MATQSLHPESVPATRNDSEALYYAYRHAKAAWELALYAPEMMKADLPPEINDALSDAHTDALDRYLLASSNSTAELAQKLRVCRDEEICDGWHIAGAVMAVLARDAERLVQATPIG